MPKARDTKLLRTLAERAGIISEYLDQSGRETRQTTDATRVRLLAALGIDASTDARTRKALKQLEAEEQRPLQPVRVASSADVMSGKVVLTLPSRRKKKTEWQIEIEREDGTDSIESGTAKAGEVVEFRIPADLPEGYHLLRLTSRGGAGDHDLTQSLIVVPPHCPSATKLAGTVVSSG